MPEDSAGGALEALGIDLVVIVSGSRYHGVRRSGRGIADAMAQRVPVLFVDPPASALTASNADDGGRMWRPRLVAENDMLTRLQPAAPPGKDRRGVQSLTRTLLARQIRGAVGASGATRTLLIQQSAHRSVLGRAGEHASIYHATDDLAAGSDLLGVDRDALAEAQMRAARTADLTLAVSPLLAERWSRLGVRAQYLPNGVDVEAFRTHREATPAHDVELRRPIAGVVGTLSERLDLDILSAVAQRMNLLLVGPESFRIDRSGFSDLVASDSVQWVGGRAFEDLPAYYAHIDVGLVPYTLSDFNRASFPLKTLEYLAAGKPVVATPLDSVLALDPPATVVADTPEAFAAAAVDAAQGMDEATATSVEHFIDAQSWDRRVDDLLIHLAEVAHA